ncbi:Growth-regulating factor 4-like protein, partial [Drosera capensis]
MSGGLTRTKFPFTPTQWQELEHQSLIYKYMAAGIPIPHDLLFAVKRSLGSSLSSPASKFFPYQASLGWNPYQMGYGKKLDPEPGRCRRTDGKKWRCSKEAYPDSKYCERHMHRGKNRSRKPVEALAATPPANAATITAGSASALSVSSMNKNNTDCGANPSSFHSLSSLPPMGSSDNSYDTQHLLLYPHSASSRGPAGMGGLSSQDHSGHLLLESGSLRDRYLHGVKEEIIGEHAFFSEASGTMRGYSAGSPSMDEPWQLNHFRSSSSSLNRQKQNSSLQSGYPYLELKSEAQMRQDHRPNQECYVWGRDFNTEMTLRNHEKENEPQKTIHHFFDEWPPKGSNSSRDSWNDSSSSTTQLSISMPTNTTSSSHHDFFLTNSRTHNGNYTGFNMFTNLLL